MVFIGFNGLYICISLALIALAVLARRSARHQRPVIREIVRIASLLVAVPAIGATIISGLNARHFFYSEPIYSPHHTAAVRLESNDGGRDMTAVLVYTHHGLSSDYVYKGYRDATKPSEIQWLSDSHLVIRYDPKTTPFFCVSTPTTTVECEPHQPTGTQ